MTNADRTHTDVLPAGQGDDMPDSSGVVSRVAIVMRTKDRPILLVRAFVSVLGQKFQNWHLFLVNDGGTREVLERTIAPYHKKFANRLTIFHNSRALGMEAASNVAVRSALSENLGFSFCIIHDDDDSWNPDFLLETVAYLSSPQNSDKGGVCTQSLVVEEVIEGGKVRVLGEQLFSRDLHAITLPQFLDGNKTPPIAFLFRTKLFQEIGLFDENLPVLGDWDFILRVLIITKVGFIAKPLAHYHLRQRSNDIYGNSVIAGISHHETTRQDYDDTSMRNAICRNPDLFPIFFQMQNNVAQLRREIEELRSPFHDFKLWIYDGFFKHLFKLLNIPEAPFGKKSFGKRLDSFFYQVIFKHIEARFNKSVGKSQRHVSNLLLLDKDTTNGVLRDVGQNYLSLMLGSFVRWIAQEAQVQGVDKIYFLSRDGWIVKRAWERLAAAGYVSKEIEVHYAELSRRSLWVPTLETIDDNALDEFLLAGPPIKRTVRTFLERVGLEIDAKIRKKIKKYFSSEKAVIENEPRKNKSLRKLFFDLESEIRELASEEKQHALGYFRQIGLFGDNKKKIIVDLGWHASMQARLIKLLMHQDPDAKAKIIGLYAGLFFKAVDNFYETGFAQGMFCTPFTTREVQLEFQMSVSLLETLHLAPHGSVVRYKKNGDEIFEPIYANNEQEQSIYAELIKPIQDTALDSLLNDLNTNVRTWENLSPQTYSKTLQDLTIRPKSVIATVLGQIRHWSSIEHSGQLATVIPPKSPSTFAEAKKILAQTNVWVPGTLMLWLENEIFPQGTFCKLISEIPSFGEETKSYFLEKLYKGSSASEKTLHSSTVLPNSASERVKA